MNEVDAVYYLATNSDGGQNTRYPLGNKPSAVIPAVPTNFKAGIPGVNNVPLSWEHDGQNLTGFELQQWILGTSTAWTPPIDYPDAVTRIYDALGLPQLTHIGHRLRSINGDQVSAWAPEVWVDTDYDTGGTTPPDPGSEWGGLTPNKFVTASAVTGVGDGSSGNPWSWEDACDNAQSGDIVGWYAGVYVGKNPRPSLDSDLSEIELLRGAPAMSPKNSGTEGNPIIMVAQYFATQHSTDALYTDLRSGSDGKDPKTGGDWGHPTFAGRHSYFGWPTFGVDWSSPANYISWMGMYSDARKPNNKGIEDCGIATIRSTTRPTLQHCKLIADPNEPYKGNNWSAVRLEHANYCQVTDNYISGFETSSGWDNNVAGILGYETYSMNNSNNHILNCNHGVQYKRSWANGNILSGKTNNNIFENCHQMARMHSYGVEEFRSEFMHNLGINTKYFMNVTDAVSDRGLLNVDYMHNTMSGGNGNDPSTFHWSAWSVAPSGCRFVNNVFSKSGRYNGAYGRSMNTINNMGEWDFNCVHGFSNFAMTNEGGSDTRHTWTHAEWKAASGQEMNTITQDPQFVDVSGRDFRLQPGSPAENGQGGVSMGCYITGSEVIGIRDIS